MQHFLYVTSQLIPHLPHSFPTSSQPHTTTMHSLSLVFPNVYSPSSFSSVNHPSIPSTSQPPAPSNLIPTEKVKHHPAILPHTTAPPPLHSKMVSSISAPPPLNPLPLFYQTKLSLVPIYFHITQ
jgi:hypothetical protein